MSEKIFVRKECYDIYEYVGACPDCGVVQTSPYENNVDRVCNKCIFKRGEEIILSRMADKIPYVGSIITNWQYDKYHNLNIQIIDSQMKVHEIMIRDRVIVNDFDITALIPQRCEAPMIPRDDSYLIRIFKRFIK